MKQLYSCFLHMALSRTWRIRTVRRRYQELNMRVTKLFFACWIDPWASIEAIEAINVGPSRRGAILLINLLSRSPGAVSERTSQCFSLGLVAVAGMPKIALTISDVCFLLACFCMIINCVHYNSLWHLSTGRASNSLCVSLFWSLTHVASSWISKFFHNNIDAIFVGLQLQYKLIKLSYQFLDNRYWSKIDHLRIVHMSLPHASANLAADWNATCWVCSYNIIGPLSSR
jgi:hypothetical protein